MGWVLFVLGVVLVSLLAGVGLAFYVIVPRLERAFLFRPSRQVVRTPADLGMVFDQHFIETADGCRLSAWHMRPASPVGSVLYFHGNGGNLGILNEVFDMLYRGGLEILAVDYRGYGWSSVNPSEVGLYEDAMATARYFRENLKAPELPLLYWGRSLGSCVAAYAASQAPPDGLILETAFPSKASLMKHYPQFKVFYPFSRCRLDTVRHLRDHIFPVLLLHGDRDRTIPLQEGRALFEQLTGPKEFLCIKGADHINLHRVGSEVYLRRVVNFVRQVRPLPAN